MRPFADFRCCRSDVRFMAESGRIPSDLTLRLTERRALRREPDRADPAMGQMAAVMVPRGLLQTILGAIAALRPLPPARC